MSKRTHILIFLIFSTLPLTNLIAQDSTKSKHSLQEGKRALIFQVTNNFSLNSFNGSVFSYKKQLSQKKAMRTGLSLNTRLNWADYPDDADERSDANTNFQIFLRNTWLNYINPESDIKFFYGYGPGVNFGYGKFERDDINRNQLDRNYTYGISAIGYMGVEWFFNSSMSLHAEYHSSLDFSYNKQIREIDFTDETMMDLRNEQNSSGIELSGNNVRFGLSVYF